MSKVSWASLRVIWPLSFSLFGPFKEGGLYRAHELTRYFCPATGRSSSNGSGANPGHGPPGPETD